MSIHIIQCGTQSPLGTWTSMSAANVRAGIARVTTHPKFEDSQWNPVKVAMADYLDPGTPNQHRFFQLGIEALKQTLAPLENLKSKLNSIPLLIGLPAEREGLHEELEVKFREKLIAMENKLSISFQTEFFPFDHTSGLIGLKEAIKHLESSEVEFCIAGGIESYMSLATLAWLEKQGRLKCTNNKWGMVPGEAAGFCLLSSSETAKKYNLSLAAEIIAIENVEEKAKEDDVCLGKALSHVLEKVFSVLPEGEKVQQVFCDMNGQRHRVDEYAYTVSRLSKYFSDPQDFIAPANMWGDLGAASVPLLISLAMESGRKSYAKGPNNLIFAMSPNGGRSAALIRLNGI